MTEITVTAEAVTGIVVGVVTTVPTVVMDTVAAKIKIVVGIMVTAGVVALVMVVPGCGDGRVFTAGAHPSAGQGAQGVEEPVLPQPRVFGEVLQAANEQALQSAAP